MSLKKFNTISTILIILISINKSVLNSLTAHKKEKDKLEFSKETLRI